MANLSVSYSIMSKGNMLLGQARGKMGSIVFFVRDGVQQQRPYNPEPKNPRTLAQMYQRVKLASVVGFYKRQASFFRFALKKKARESYYNAFVRYNLNIAPYLTKGQAEAGYQIAAPYIVSDGDMPRVDVTNVTVSVGNEITVQTSINSSLTTWGAFRRAYGLLIGDMVSFVLFNRSSISTDAAQRIVAQHVFDQESENLPFGYDVVGLTFTEIAGTWSFNVAKNYYGITEWYAAAAAVITSRNTGSVDCSYAQLVLSEMAEAEYIVYRSEEQHQEAAASYGSVSTAILDPNSFEGNYVDVAPLYGNAAHNIRLTEASVTEGGVINAYYDNVKMPNIQDVEVLSSTPFSAVGDVSFNASNGTITITATDEAPEEGTASADVVLQWVDINSVVVAHSIIKITVVAQG